MTSIVSKEGELITTGCNEVPKNGGGYYNSDDLTRGTDGRCKNRHNYMCKNHEMKEELILEINAVISKHLDTDKVDVVSGEIARIEKLKGLIEFCRSVHAEMDAITNVDREGKLSLRKSSIYSTTFPCHHCARHIVASGISKVYYIEPYEKSLARLLHDDSIEFDPINETESNGKKVVFSPFEGVAPKQYLNLFQAGNRKTDGRKTEINIRESMPTVQQLLDTFLDYEKKAVKHFRKTLKSKIS